LRPAESGIWELCWYDGDNRPIQAVYFHTTTAAVTAIRGHTTGIAAWDDMFGSPANIESLRKWDEVESFP
jgi:hypothetical protein